MTHTLVRLGDIDSLRKDFVVIFCGQDPKHVDPVRKLHEAWKIMNKYKPLHIRFTKHTIEVVTSENVRDLHCVTDDREVLKSILKDTKDSNLGLSVTVSGLMDEVTDIAKEVGLQPHSIDLFVGIFGEKKNLPKPEVLEVMTMCGHGYVSKGLVEQAIKGVRDGRIKARDAVAAKLIPPCGCSVFNPARAEELIIKAAKKGKSEER